MVERRLVRLVWLVVTVQGREVDLLEEEVLDVSDHLPEPGEPDVAHIGPRLDPVRLVLAVHAVQPGLAWLVSGDRSQTEHRRQLDYLHLLAALHSLLDHT